MGFWRFKQVLDSHGIRATVSLNASVCLNYPQLVRESLESDWEMLGHGFIRQVINNEPDSRAVIRKTISTIQEFTGTAHRGWMGPGLSEERIEYVADWCNDDQPYEMKVKSGRLMTVPYTMELNDIPIYLTQHHRSPEIFERARDQFDTLYRKGADSARVMCISTHPYITGVPHRIKYYDMIFDCIRRFEGVVFMTGSEVLDWYNSEAEST